MTMCQYDIYSFLSELRKSGDHDYYTVSDIQTKMKQAGHKHINNIHEKVTRLWWFGFLDKSERLKNGKEKLYNRRMFRAKV